MWCVYLFTRTMNEINQLAKQLEREQNIAITWTIEANNLCSFVMYYKHTKKILLSKHLFMYNSNSKFTE